jgi:outer membrane protein assembly factor BamB
LLKRVTNVKYLLYSSTHLLKVKNLEKLKTKSKISAITFVILLTISAVLVAFPAAKAHTPPWEIATFAFISVAPDPIGVNQQLNILMWLDKVIYNADMANDIRFHNYKLTITKPNGEIETVTFDVCQDTTSSQYYAYIPDQIGAYTFKFEYPGQTYTWDDPVINWFTGMPSPNEYTNDTYSASSATTTLTVQEDPIIAITSYPLPNEYWTRPIYGENTDWWSISSNWPGTSSPALDKAYKKYLSGAVGSKTNHIMWTKPLQSGGVVGGTDATLGDTYFEGTAYLLRYTNPIIVAGKLYYKEPVSYAGSSSGPTVCVDLRTGEVIWSRTDVPALSFAYIYDYDDPNYHGVWQPILIAAGGGWFSPIPAGTWMGYDADTGNWLFNVTNIPSGATALGPRGEYFIYVIKNAGTTENPDYRLYRWNSFKLGYTGGFSNNAISGMVDGGLPSRYDWNVSLPWLNTMDSQYAVLDAYYNDIMLCYNSSQPTVIQGGDTPCFGGQCPSVPYTYFAVNLDESKGTVGSVLWWNTVNPPASEVTVLFSGVDPDAGVFVEEYRQTAQWVGYSLRTGEKIWGPTESQLSIASFDYYGNQFSGAMVGQFAYGRLYSLGFSGIMFCYNATTGDLLWTYGNGGEGNSTSSGYYNAYGHYPMQIYAIGNGVIYTLVYEHTVTTPIYKGPRTRAIDAFDGTEIWTLSDYGSTSAYAIADGYSTFMNGHDNQVYVVGRGPSTTTVSINNDVVNLGSSVMITGTVIDTAAGTKQDEQAARFPNGVPAVSDECMTDWMEYVYQQKPKPEDVTGVPVKLAYKLPDGSWKDIDQVISDDHGNFGFKWTPPDVGTYLINAFFLGSDAYWGSSATTYVSVDPAPEEYPVPPTAEEIADTTISRLPAYPDVPSATEVAQETVSQLPAYPEIPDIPAYLTIDLVILAIAVIVLVIGLLAYMALRKQK